MPLKTSLILTQVQSSSVEEIAQGMSGYRLDLAVVSAVNIDPKIFIMHREVLSVGVLSEEDPEPYEDTFYSVSSVPQIESIPEAATDDMPFYRVSSISLVFDALEDLVSGLATIRDLIERLQIANDLVINLLPEVRIGFPAEAIARFWGITAETTITDEILLGAAQDAKYEVALDKVISNDAGPRYFYFAYPATLDDVTTFQINSLDVDVTLVTRNVATVEGLSVSYKIYRTDDTIDSNTFIAEIT